MNPAEPSYQEYREEHNRIASIQVQNMLNHDSVLVQISGGLLALLGSFGKELLTTNIALSYFVIIPLGLTILQAILGYFLSDR